MYIWKIFPKKTVNLENIQFKKWKLMHYVNLPFMNLNHNNLTTTALSSNVKCPHSRSTIFFPEIPISAYWHIEKIWRIYSIYCINITSWIYGVRTKLFLCLKEFRFSHKNVFVWRRDKRVTEIDYNLWYAIFSTECSIVYKYCTRPISKHLYSGIFKDPLDTKHKFFKIRLNS